MFAINRTNNCSTIKELRHILPWKFACLSRVVFHNFSEWLLLKIPQQTKACSKSATEKDTRTDLVKEIWSL